MALSQRLELRQSHALVMTPQLMQAIKLLQLSNLDLASYVEDELERNPLLERLGEDGPGTPAADPDASTAQDPDIRPAVREDDNELRRETAPADEPDSIRLPFSDGTGLRRAEGRLANASDPHRDNYNPESFLTAETTLRDHLAQQLVLAIADPARRMIGQYLIDMVDEAGYLAGDLALVGEKLGASAADVGAVLAILQGFEPVGVCARNLAECLALQLRERNRFDPAMQSLIDHLDLLAKREIATLRKICDVSDDDLADMIAEVRNLNPKPGLAFGSVLVQPIVPDVFVHNRPDGGFSIELNSDTLPKVLVNQRYHAEIARTATSEHDRSYLADCLQSATWLVRALDQRAKTILKVATEIVRQQDGFFAHGVQRLRPLNLKAIADAIGMHESTVSRVTANKYMATSRGIFELKYFFTAAISAADGGEAHSAEAVRHRIRQLIEAEAGDGVLSDDAIVAKLRAAGIDIARRTVAKYREAMRIPSSVQRRRERQSALRVLA
jgi:RNA polymerase sigma-54 factor